MVIRAALAFAGRRLVSPSLMHLYRAGRGNRLNTAGNMIADRLTNNAWSHYGMNRLGRRGSTEVADKYTKGHTPPKVTDTVKPISLKIPLATKSIDFKSFDKVSNIGNPSNTMRLRPMSPREEQEARRRAHARFENSLKIVDKNFDKVDKSIRDLDTRITKSDGRLDSVIKDFNQIQKKIARQKQEEKTRERRAVEKERQQQKSRLGLSRFNNFGSRGAVLEGDNDNTKLKKAQVNSPSIPTILAGLAAALGFSGITAFTTWFSDARKAIGDRLKKDMDKRDKDLRAQKGPGALAGADYLAAKKSGDTDKISQAKEKLKLRGQYILEMGKRGVSNALAQKNFEKNWRPGMTLQDLTGKPSNKYTPPMKLGASSLVQKKSIGTQRDIEADMYRMQIEQQKSRFLQFGALPQGFEFLPQNQGRLGNPAAVAARGAMPMSGAGFMGSGQYTGSGSMYRGQSSTRHHRTATYPSSTPFSSVTGAYTYTPNQGGTVAPGQASQAGAWRNRVNVPYRGIPASVRYNNPGASYPRKRDELFGIQGYGIIGGGHKIGKYPSTVHGLASNMDLFSRSKHYQGKTLAQATRTWRGGATGPVPRFKLEDGTEIGPNTVITPELTSNPEFMRKVFTAYARHEAGRSGNPITTEQINQAFNMKEAGGIAGFKKKYPNFKPTELTKRTSTPKSSSAMPSSVHLMSRDQAKQFKNSTAGNRTISADFNYSDKPSRDAGFLMVAPNNATKEEIKQAQAYRDGFGKLMSKYGYKDYKNIMAADGKPGKFGAGIVSTKENLARINKDRVAANRLPLKRGGGMPGFFHLESGLANDPKFAEIYNSEEFQKEHAQLLKGTMGQIKGANIIAPHTQSRQGAHMPVGNGKTMSEREFYRQKMYPHLANAWNQNSAKQQVKQSLMPAGTPKSALQQIDEFANRQTIRPSTGKVNQLQMRKAAVRRQPISGKLKKVLDYASAQAGVEVDIWSGGQPHKGSGGKRVGSTRHDGGNAADLDLYVTENGKRRKLSSKNGKDRVIIANFIKNAAAAGATGIGTGQGYMGDGRLHVGFGRAATWGGGMTGDYKHAWRQGMKMQGKVDIEAGTRGGDPVRPEWAEAQDKMNQMRKITPNTEKPHQPGNKKITKDFSAPKSWSPPMKLGGPVPGPDNISKEEIARRIAEDENGALPPRPKAIIPKVKTVVEPPKEDAAAKAAVASADVEAKAEVEVKKGDAKREETAAKAKAEGETTPSTGGHRQPSSSGRFPRNNPESQPASEGSGGYGSFGRCFV